MSSFGYSLLTQFLWLQTLSLVGRKRKYIEKTVSFGSHNEQHLLKIISSQINDIRSQTIGDLRCINHSSECHAAVEPERVVHGSNNEYALHFDTQYQ